MSKIKISKKGVLNGQIKIKMEPKEIVLTGVIAIIFALYFLSFRIVIGIFVALLATKFTQRYFNAQKNPLAQDSRKPRKPYIIDQKLRDKVIKQSFSIEKVPLGLDAIIIGSGIGGMTTGVLMAKSGKKVLVLEQHDQAGGCCHTFIDKGYEFDVGIHYIGEVNPGNLNRTFIDQITDGQLEWEPLNDIYDIVQIEYDEEKKRNYEIVAGTARWKALLHQKFPEETDAINRYFEMVKETESFETLNGLLKLIPLWLAWIIVHSGLIHLISNLWTGIYKKSTLEVIQDLTQNKDLQTIFTYCWGDYGCSPKESHFIMQGLLNNHFMKTGGYYPIGGASEIALNMIPIIESAGGKVLVKAEVTDILVNQSGKACGVTVRKGETTHELFATNIISNAGLDNTFKKLLPVETAKKSYYSKLFKELKPGWSAMSVFVGMKASNEELGLKAQNVWAFTDDAIKDYEHYSNLDVEKMQDARIPLLFISFPSAKDPNWNLHPGRKDKSTCAIITLARWEWYEKWQNRPLKRRGDDYDAIKNSVAHQMIKQACELFPQMEDKIDLIEIGTPITNKHYIGSPHGEIYGLDHDYQRMSPWMMALTRPETDIPGLYITGQDALLCGFTGALFGGLLCASTVLKRNVMQDLENLHAKLEENK